MIGQLYYTRVFSFNSIGFSTIAGVAPLPQKPTVVPGPSTGVTIQVNSVSELKVIFSPPEDSGGDTVTAYPNEWSNIGTFDTSQTTLLSGGAPFFKIVKYEDDRE